MHGLVSVHGANRIVRLQIGKGYVMVDTFTMGATTRYHGPTNTRGSRIVVELANGARVTVPYDHSGNAHVSAVTDAARRSGFMVHDVAYLTESESRRGNVYVVTVSEGVPA